jgi:D-glycero-alpha-D-manno-heptose 1-phosphate guanylyltransferase
MEAIILCGGLGTRLRPAVSDVPKSMAPILGRPFLELLLLLLKSRGLTRAILSLGYMADSITSYFNSNPLGIDLEYEIETSPLGTGGAIAASLKRVRSDCAFVFNGDTYLDLDVAAVAAMWPGDRSPVIVARNVSDTERFGRLEISNGRISRFSGAGQRGEGVINAGCYLLPRNNFSSGVWPDSFSFEQDYLSHCAPNYLRTFISVGKFIDIGVPEDFERAQTELAHLA